MAPQRRTDGFPETLKINRCRQEPHRLSLLDEMVLIYIKRRKFLMKNGQPTRNQCEEMKAEIEKEGREYGYKVDLEVDHLMSLVETSKIALRNKMREYIVKRRMKKKDMEEAIRKWRNYDHVKFLRSFLGEDEKEMWEEQEKLNEMGVEIEEEEEIVEEEEEKEEEIVEVEEEVNDENMPPDEELTEKDSDEKTGEEVFSKEIVVEEEEESFIPVAIVINPENIELPPHPKVKIVSEYIQKVPFSCSKSIAALKQGTVEVSGAYPGLPNKKFHSKDLNEKVTLDTWPIQTVFENREKPGHWIVLFEAVIDSFHFSELELRKSAREALNKAKTRVKFIESLKARSLGNDYRFGSTPLFRDFEDVSYIHSKIHEKFGMGRVTYMSLIDPSQAPPLYENTPVNLMTAEVYIACIERKANKPFKMKGPTLIATPKGCENPEGCMCNEKFQAIYSKRCSQNLEPNSKGLLDLSGLDEKIFRILIECADDCGCSLNCPRRQVQRRKTPPTVVYYGGEVGYTLRSLAKILPGQYIGEYTGWLKFPKANDDQSYEAGVGVMNHKMVICARRAGSVIRFMSHSCDPSAVFVVTHSREKETDPLIPRLAVFALKEINIGDPITIKYYNKRSLVGVKRTIKCLCESANCIGYLPG